MTKSRRGSRGKDGINKAQIIRDALKKLGMDATAKDVQAYAAEHDATVAAAQISNIRTKLKKGKGMKAGRKGGKEPTYTESELFGAREMAEQVGGVERAKELLDILFRLRPSDN